MESPDTDLAGTARFEILGRIGAGGMGVVYKALDRELGVEVALKTLLRVDATELARFKAEFRALADLRHPNWVRFGDLFVADGRWFFSMELIHGTDFLSHVSGTSLGSPADDTLAAAGARSSFSAPAASASDLTVELGSAADGAARPAGACRRPFDEVRLRAASLALARGLHALHGAGKVHCDVKPSNVMVTPEGRVVLLDFGLVSGWREKRAGGDSVIGGTVAYMAPEQASPKPVGPAADWYAVGVVLYEALTGSLPHSGTMIEILSRKQSDTPRPPGEHGGDVPADLAELCMALLRVDPEERPRGDEILRRLAGASSWAAELRPPAHDGEARFVGRGRELELLRDALADSRRAGVSVFLTGESGLGKSALARQFAERVVDEDKATLVLAGRCYEGEWVPFKALDGVVDELARHLARLPSAEVLPLLPDHVGLLAHTFLVLRQVEAIAGMSVPRRESIEPRELRVRVFAALRELLGRLAARAPLVVMIDDLQWADADSLSLLRELLHQPGAPTLLLVVTLRTPSGEAAPTPHALLGTSREALGDVRALSLDRLSVEQSRALAADLLGGADKATELAAESGGHPLFLQELARHRLHAGAGDQAPILLDEALWDRAMRLDPVAFRLLETVVVAGARITQDVAALAADLGPADYALHVGGLRSESLVRTTGRRGSDEVEPYHDRVREAVASRLSAEVRRSRHRRLALAIEQTAPDDSEKLALHWQGAREPRRAAACAALAAARAEEAFAFDRAARFFQLALELGGHDRATTSELQERLGDCLANAGRGPTAADAYLAAASDAEPRRVLGLRRRAAEQLLRVGRIDEGGAELRTVLAAVGMELQPTPVRALASLLVRRVRVRLRGIGFRPRAAADIAPETLEHIDVCLSAGTALGLVDNIRAADLQARGLLLALEAGEPLRVARSLAVEACFASTQGAGGAARAEMLLEAARSAAAKLGDPFVLAWCSLAEGMVAYCLGDFRRSHEASARARTLFTDRCTGVAWERETADLYANLSAVYLGRLDEVFEAVERGRREADERHDLFASTYVRAGLVLTPWLGRDDPASARREVDDTVRKWSSRGYFLAHYWCFVANASIDLYEGDGLAAYNRVHAEWPALTKSLLLRTVQIIRVESIHVRARAALARASAEPAASSRFLREAEADARRIESEAAPYAMALGGLVRAAIASLRHDRRSAIAALDAAAATFDAGGMALLGAIARFRRGHLLGGVEGDQQAEAAEGWMRDHGVVAPARMADALAPGFEGTRHPRMHTPQLRTPPLP